MKLLEKQKEQKSRLKEQSLNALPPKTESNFPSLTVVIQNDSRFIQTETDTDKKSSELIKAPIVTTKVATNKTSNSSPNTSLAKKVLVKNAIDSLISTKIANESAQTIESAANGSAFKSITTTAASVQAISSEQKVNNGTETKDETESKTSISLEIFAKKTPKFKASILANYVKKYNSHGYVFFFHNELFIQIVSM